MINYLESAAEHKNIFLDTSINMVLRLQIFEIFQSSETNESDTFTLSGQKQWLVATAASLY